MLAKVYFHCGLKTFLLSCLWVYSLAVLQNVVPVPAIWVSWVHVGKAVSSFPPSTTASKSVVLHDSLVIHVHSIFENTGLHSSTVIIGRFLSPFLGDCRNGPLLSIRVVSRMRTSFNFICRILSVLRWTVCSKETIEPISLGNSVWELLNF